jgi:pyruvate decarboxylase
VLNNDGYTIERLIHGKDAFYNKVPDWNYAGLAKVFGPEYPSKYWGPIGTAEALDDLVADPEFNDSECFRLVELKLGYLDAPAAVRQASAAVETFNQKKSSK